jgi:hypothetical protein
MICGEVRGTGATGPTASWASPRGRVRDCRLLIASGAVWLVAGAGANAAVAADLGMLLYTVIASPGYFLARRELPVVGMFGVLAALTAIALAVAVT